MPHPDLTAATLYLRSLYRAAAPLPHRCRTAAAPPPRAETLASRPGRSSYAHRAHLWRVRWRTNWFSFWGESVRIQLCTEPVLGFIVDSFADRRCRAPPSLALSECLPTHPTARHAHPHGAPSPCAWQPSVSILFIFAFFSIQMRHHVMEMQHPPFLILQGSRVSPKPSEEWSTLFYSDV